MADEYRLLTRYVRPIYDAIDNRQYKAALKLCLHKKIAHLDIVLVLKAHCLERTGRPDEALALCRAVQTRAPTDETLLNTMYLVFRLCGREDEMLPTFEHACAHVSPPSEELFQSLFGAYARRGDYLKQQQTALKMFRAFGKLKYVCWAALSMLFQVQHGGAPAKMLGLADRMLLKAMRDTKSDDGEALQLLVHILELEDKRDEALAVFDEFAPIMAAAKDQPSQNQPAAGHCHDGHCSHSHGPATKGRAAEGEGAYDEDIELGPMQTIDRLALEATLTKAQGLWERSADVYGRLLESFNADDWTYLKEYIDARFQQAPGAVMRTAEESLAWLEALATAEGKQHYRGPWLARVHVHAETLKRLGAVEAGDKSETLASVEAALADEILTYAERFHTKTCCFTDLKQYLALTGDPAIVSPGIKATLVQRFSKMAEEATATVDHAHEEAGRKEALNRLHRRLLCLKVLRYLGVYDGSEQCSVPALEDLARTLIAEYEANSWLNVGSTGGQREVQHTDDLLLLAVHTLVDIYQRQSHRREVLIEAAALLEYGLENSAYNFQMKLLLSRLYGYLAAGEAMLARHKELDVKHVQLDSLSFLVLDKLLQLGQHPDARRLCESIRRLHESTAADTPEYISRAYRLGVYSKVLDMTGFLRERMQQSHTLAIARGELLQFDLQDALSSGGAKLIDFATSARLETALTALRTMVVGPDAKLSRNQHREVIVEWGPRPLIPSGDAFAGPNEPLVECDRSATFETSRQWLQLQLVVPTLLRHLVTGVWDGVESLRHEYDALIGALGLTSGVATGGIKAGVWAWSQSVVNVVARLAGALQSTSESDIGSLAEQIKALEAPLDDLRDALVAGLPSPPAPTALGVSAAALLVRDAGLWGGALLAVIHRVWGKRRGKKDDPCGVALRGVLKHVQDVVVAVEAHVKAVDDASSDPSPSGADAPVVVASASAGLLEARATVEKQLARSHAATRRGLGELLHQAAAAIRVQLQK